MHPISLEQFEGPLDLLLQLIEQEKLQITDIALSQVTEQYIKLLERASADRIPAEELADFLVIAARLLLLKSRALLPFLQWEDEEAEQLSTQLRIYKAYADAAKVMQGLLRQRQISSSREKLLLNHDVGFQPPQKLTAARLGEVYREILRALTPTTQVATEVMRRTVSLQEKIEQIRSRIMEVASTRFSEVLQHATNKGDVIVSFLALLELVKQQVVVVHQEQNFADILIHRASTPTQS